MPNPKRPSMRGMGADAFFEKPVTQQAGETVEQQTGKPVSQLVKATFYLTPDHVLKLEQLRLDRKRRGHKVDKSALIREAIELLQS